MEDKIKRKQYNNQYYLLTKEQKKEQRKEYYLQHKEKYDQYTIQWKKDNPEKVQQYYIQSKYSSWNSCIKQRANKLNVPFDLTPECLRSITPEVCPILGLILESNRGKRIGGTSPNSPSVDRLVPSLGYVQTNVIVVSHRANMLRSNATPTELRLIADYYESLLGTSPVD